MRLRYGPTPKTELVATGWVLTNDAVDPVLSCSDRATPQNVDTCCSETYGGLVVSFLHE